MEIREKLHTKARRLSFPDDDSKEQLQDSAVLRL
jgi:hypothetical protein